MRAVGIMILGVILLGFALSLEMGCSKNPKDENEAIQAKDVDELHTLAMGLAEKQEYSKALRCYDRALELEPDNASIHSYKGGLLMVMGRYREALPLMQRAVVLGREQDKRHVTSLKRILRQIEGEYLPPKGWLPEYEDYLNILEDFRQEQGWLVYSMVDRIEDLPKPGPGQAISSIGAPGTKIGFGGSEEEPILFSANYYVWDGAWINDPKYGLLLTNGTKFKREVIEGEKRVVYIGDVRDWKLQPLRSRRETLAPK